MLTGVTSVGSAWSAPAEYGLPGDLRNFIIGRIAVVLSRGCSGGFRRVVSQFEFRHGLARKSALNDDEEIRERPQRMYNNASPGINGKLAGGRQYDLSDRFREAGGVAIFVGLG